MTEVSDEVDEIVVSAVILRGVGGRVLTVRKAGTARFMLPGGKPEAGEGPEQAAVREVREELSVELQPERLELLGTFSTPAANEPDRHVVATVFSHPAVPVDAPAAEIEELRWLDLGPGAPLPPDLAPLLSEALVPLLRDRGEAAGS